MTPSPETAPTPLTPNAPTPPASVTTKTAQDLWTEIEAAAKCKLGESPVTLRFVWFPASPGGDPTVFSVGHPAPIKQDYLVFAIFHDAHEARIYALPKVPKPDPTGLPARLVLSKHTPVVASEILHPDVFVEILADELAEAASLDDEEDEDPALPSE